MKIGKNTRAGKYTVIDNDVVLGDDVMIGDFCKLHSGTRIGNNVKFDDYCNTSGTVLIGNDVHIKRMSCITQGTVIEDKVFIGPGIMIIHEKNVSFQRNVKKISRGVHIKSGAIIGGSVTLVSGITIGKDVIVGAGAVVVKDCEEGGIYLGCPAVRVGEVPLEDRIGIDCNLNFTDDIVEKYLSEMESTGKLLVNKRFDKDEVA